MPKYEYRYDGFEITSDQELSPDAVKAYASGKSQWSGQNYIDAAKGIGTGIAKGVGNAVVGLGNLATEGGLDRDSTPEGVERMTPHGGLEKVGNFGVQAAEFALIPEGRIAKMGTGFSGVLARAAARGAGGAAVESVNEGKVSGHAVGAGAINAGFGVAGEAASALSKSLYNSALRSLIKILNPKTPQDEAMAVKMAERMVQEKLAPAGANYDALAGPNMDEIRAGETYRSPAQLAKENAIGEKTSVLNRLQNEDFNPHPVLNDIASEIPERAPESQMLPPPRPRPTGRRVESQYGKTKAAPTEPMETRMGDVRRSVRSESEDFNPLFPPAYKQGRKLVKAGDNALDDATNVVNANSRNAKIDKWADDAYDNSRVAIPLRAAQREKERLDNILEPMYRRGATNAPQSMGAIQGGADSWRHHIADQFPELGVANLRAHELIVITKLLREAADVAKRQGVSASAEGGIVGGLATGRQSVPAMISARLGFASPQFRTMSSAAFRTLSRLAKNGPEMSRWLAIASEAGVPEDSIELPSGVPRAPEE